MATLRSRSVPASVVRALSLAAAAGALSAPARVWAAEPSQQELMEQVKALRAKVERLEAAETSSTRPSPQDTSAPAPASDDAAAQTLRDADSRSHFLQTSGTFTAGYNKGKFLIQDDKGNFVLHPQLQFMPRWTANYRENAKRGGEDADFQSGFEIRRLKLGFDGNVFNPNATYMFLWATDRNSGNLILEEGWAKYAFKGGALNNFAVKAGQFKDPFAHESLTSSKRLLAAERTLINDVFTGGDNFVQGASLAWDDGPEGSPFRAEVAYTDGANGANQNFQDFPATKANFGVSGRLEYLAFGKWAQYEDFTTVDNKPGDRLLVIGAGVDLTEAGNNDTLLHTVDAQFESGPLGLYAAYLGRSVEDARVGSGAAAADVNGYDWGFIVQAAYMVDKHLEPFVRYDFISFDDNLTAASVKETDVHEFTVGFNYYYKSHNAKLTFDFSYLPNGTPVADSGADILASDDEAEFLVRTQFQLLL
jgi:hypothetical protein